MTQEEVSQMKTVYACFSTDELHEGHINIINQARKYGKVVIGALSDEEVVRYNRYPRLSVTERMDIYKQIDGVDEIIVQHDLMYDDVVQTLKPDYVIHGDNWLNEPGAFIRKHVKRLLDTYGGAVLDVPYTQNEDVQRKELKMIEKLAMAENRRKRLRQLLELNHFVRVIEAHNGLTGLIAEKTVVPSESGMNQFDAMWISSLCDSTERGKPDIGVVNISDRMQTIEDILEVTTKPIIFDGDSGGLTEHFIYNVRSLERIGVSAVIIEDKIGAKRNSLLGAKVHQTQDSILNFSNKIKAGKKAQISDDFMIIARIESLILEKGLEDAIERAKAYIFSGADGIMIHSCKKNPDEIIEFCDSFRNIFSDIPLVVVPSTFNSVTEAELENHGVNIVIYANQLLRAAYPAMKHAAESILTKHRAMEIDRNLTPINEIVSMIEVLQ